MEIYLVRHGLTDWNVEGRIMGDKDIPINKKGVEQSKRAALYLKEKNILKVLSSPVLRTRQTAEIVSNVLQIPFQTDERLTEISFGDWIGQIYDELKKKPGFKTYYDHPDERIIHKGEKFSDASERIVDIFDEMIGSEKNIALVTHADPIKLFLLHTLMSPLKSAGRIKIDNASISCIEFKGRPSLKFSNLTL